MIVIFSIYLDVKKNKKTIIIILSELGTKSDKNSEKSDKL